MHAECKVLSKAKLFFGKDMFSPQSKLALTEPTAAGVGLSAFA